MGKTGEQIITELEAKPWLFPIARVCFINPEKRSRGWTVWMPYAQALLAIINMRRERPSFTWWLEEHEESDQTQKK